jgi:hypothetical protein
MFAPGRAITDSCTESWWLLINSYEKLPWLEHFFVREGEFQQGVRGYKALASFVELGTRIGRDPDFDGDPRYCTVAPVFLGPAAGDDQYTSIEAVIAQAVPNGRVIDEISRATGASRQRIVAAWPNWFSGWVEQFAALYRNSIAGRRASTQWDKAPPLPL